MAGKVVRVLGPVGVTLFILCVPIFLITSNLTLAVNSVRLYEYGFNKYDVSEAIGIEDEELLRTARELMHYFNSDEESIQITVVTEDGEELDLFNAREIIHLKEVKGLIRLCYNLQLATFGCLAAIAIGGFISQRKRFGSSLAKMALGGGAITIALLILVGIAALVNFDWLFLGFHRLFFGGDTWILDPATDYLIMMFPPGFFYDAALFVVGAIIVEALIIGGLGGFFVLRGRRARG